MRYGMPLAFSELGVTVSIRINKKQDAVSEAEVREKVL